MQAQSESFDFEPIGSPKDPWMLGGLAVLVIVLVLAFFLWRRKKNKSDKESQRIIE
jgi:LPXTG-motif cell wall-anchored protein